MRRAGYLLNGLCGLAAAAGVMAATRGRAEDAQVKIDNFVFSPQVLTVKTGTRVTWVNDDDIPHLVASTTQGLRSKALDTGDKYSFTFTTPGTYKYFCGLHPHMTGSIVVEGTTGSNAPQ